jgi:hypothetical protein
MMKWNVVNIYISYSLGLSDPVTKTFSTHTQTNAIHNCVVVVYLLADKIVNL